MTMMVKWTLIKLDMTELIILNFSRIV